MNCLVLDKISKYNPSKLQDIANRLNPSSNDIMIVCPVDKQSINQLLLLLTHIVDNNLSDISYILDKDGKKSQILTYDLTSKDILNDISTVFILRNNKFVAN